MSSKKRRLTSVNRYRICPKPSDYPDYRATSFSKHLLLKQTFQTRYWKSRVIRRDIGLDLTDFHLMHSLSIIINKNYQKWYKHIIKMDISVNKHCRKFYRNFIRTIGMAKCSLTTWYPVFLHHKYLYYIYIINIYTINAVCLFRERDRREVRYTPNGEISLEYNDTAYVDNY